MGRRVGGWGRFDLTRFVATGHLGHELVPAAVHCPDDPLLGAVVADGLASGFDAGGQRRVAHESVTPNAVEELFLQNDLAPILDETDQQVEDLRFDMDFGSIAPDHDSGQVEFAFVEPIDQPSPPSKWLVRSSMAGHSWLHRPNGCVPGPDLYSWFDVGNTSAMMSWRRKNEPTALEAAEVDDIITRNVALAGRLGPDARGRLTSVTAGLITAKRWEATKGVELTPEVLVTIAANAAIPILELDDWVYRYVKWIIIHPSTTVSHGLRSGPTSGVFKDDPARIVGLATPNSGPLSLSWDASLAESRNPGTGRNVIIHEFAHKIDMSDGYSDGTPPVRGIDLERWTALLTSEYERSEPDDSDSVLRDYAWTSPAEFFAVATETFFCRPADLRAGKPDLYAALAGFYRQDPAAT